MDSSAFSRVKSLLKYRPPGAVDRHPVRMATALLYALFVLLLALFVDLLVTRGRIPGVAELPAREQEAVARDLSALPDEDRGAGV